MGTAIDQRSAAVAHLRIRGVGGHQEPALADPPSCQLVNTAEKETSSVNEANPRVSKVAVWATGGVGKYAIRTITDRPNLELTGVWAHSDDKKGRDAGELAGIDPLGVYATRDEAAILGR